MELENLKTTNIFPCYMGCISLTQNVFKFLLKDLQKWATRSVPGQNFKLGGNTPFDFPDCVHTLKETQIALNKSSF